MHRALSARWLSRALRIGESTPAAAVPTFLCPAISQNISVRSRLSGPQPPALSQRRKFHAEATEKTGALADTESLPNTETTKSESASLRAPGPTDIAFEVPPPTTRKLPVNCTGCGAFSQSHDPKQFGFYNTESKRVERWLDGQAVEGDLLTKGTTGDDQIVSQALNNLDSNQLKALGLDPAMFLSGELPGQSTEEKEGETAIKEEDKPPVCERCHNLIHHGSVGDTADTPMFHPTVDTLRETIEESPHKYNHIYHVIDAADFPMSLIPRLHVLLGDIRLRSKNRRSTAHKFHRDRQIEMSFIITRGDLLGPTKEAVDRLMPYLRDVLRDALGKAGEGVRLGNVRCVSAKRGWWTQQLREEIWKRGGAGWMVGKVNVGKSRLFESVYPKGRLQATNEAGKDDHTVSMYPRDESLSSAAEEEDVTDQDDMDMGDLLPPLQPATQYPNMPMWSSLPGTTASPIRVPFGNKKGELIDLPGMARGDLELYVRPEHRVSLVMKHRLIPEQISLNSDKSIILGGGLIRITPKTENLTFLAYNFTPLPEHVTSTEKAVEFQNGTRQTAAVQNISLPGVNEKMQLAATVKLNHDVTRRRAGPLVRKNGVNLPLDSLPFRVVSTDILIEGVGYVEVVAQVRTRDLERTSVPGYNDAISSVPVEEEMQEIEEEAPVAQDPFEAMMHNRVGTGASSPKPKPKPKPLPPTPPKRQEPEKLWPEIDVFAPEGRFIGTRRPIEGYLNNKPQVKAEHKRSRPRKSMKGVKKMSKHGRR